MSSNRELVLLAGRLMGMGRDESCMISATKVSLPGTNEFAYSGLTIQNAPNDLPDGQYTLKFKGHTEAVVKSNGDWVSAGV